MGKKSTDGSQRPSATVMRDAFQALYESLRDAYWAAPTMETKDRISGIMDVVFDIVSGLNRQIVAENTKALRALKGQISHALKHIKQLKDEIDRAIQAVRVATLVAKNIQTVTELAAGFLA